MDVWYLLNRRIEVIYAYDRSQDLGLDKKGPVLLLRGSELHRANIAFHLAQLDSNEILQTH